MSTKKKEVTSEADRLKVYATQLKVSALTAQLEALKQRQNAIMVEINALPERTKQVEEQRTALLEQFKVDYVALKEAVGVPEGKELNLETGEFVDAQRSQ